MHKTRPHIKVQVLYGKFHNKSWVWCTYLLQSYEWKNKQMAQLWLLDYWAEQVHDAHDMSWRREPYQCPHCMYTSLDTMKLKRHMITHIGSEPIAQKDTLTIHKIILCWYLSKKSWSEDTCVEAPYNWQAHALYEVWTNFQWQVHSEGSQEII